MQIRANYDGKKLGAKVTGVEIIEITIKNIQKFKVGLAKTNRRRTSFVHIARGSKWTTMLLSAVRLLFDYPLSEKYEWITRIKADDVVDIN